MSSRALEQRRDPSSQERAERWEERLAIPVLVAALLSVPAVFLMTSGGVPATVGRVLNWLSVAVLIGESLVLILLSRDVADWLRAHKWELLLVAGVISAVVFAIGPVQILRIALSVGTLRVLRVRRIVRAGVVVARKLSLGARRKKLAVGAAGLVAAVFLTIVLADPESRTRRALAWLVEHVGLPVTIIGGLVIVTGVFLAVHRVRRTRLFHKYRLVRHPSRHRSTSAARIGQAAREAHDREGGEHLQGHDRDEAVAHADLLGHGGEQAAEQGGAQREGRLLGGGQHAAADPGPLGRDLGEHHAEQRRHHHALPEPGDQHSRRQHQDPGRPGH